MQPLPPEGSHSSLDVLLLKLLIDERHTEMDVLKREPIKCRSFEAWTMNSPRVDPTGSDNFLPSWLKTDRPYLAHRDTMLDLCANQITWLSAPTGRSTSPKT